MDFLSIKISGYKIPMTMKFYARTFGIFSRAHMSVFSFVLSLLTFVPDEFARAPHSRKPPVIYIFQSDGDYAARRGVPSLIRHAPSNSRPCIISPCFYCTWGLIKVAKQKPRSTVMKGYLPRYVTIQAATDIFISLISEFIQYLTCISAIR